MLIVTTGDGKGKTTAALGQALRTIGDGRRAIMFQFIKGPWRSGEDDSVKRLHPDFKIVKGGKGFVGILGDSLPRSEHRKAAQKTWRAGRKAVLSGKYDLVIFDELNVALTLRLLALKDVLPALKKHKGRLDIIITGREAPKSLIALADLVSEVREVKHPFQKGNLARRGIEY